MSVLGVLGEGRAELTVAPSGEAVDLAFGGDAANVAVMAAHAGAEVRLCARVGDDALGHARLRFWGAKGIDTAAVTVDAAAPTGMYLNEPGPEGHRFIYWRSGSAGSRLDAGDLRPAFVDGLSLLAVTGVTLAISNTARGAARTAAARVRDQGGDVAFVVNHRPTLHTSAAELARFATGAGDALAGAYLASRLAGEPAAASLRRGVVAASLSVGRPGCAGSYPTGAELNAALEQVA